MKYSLVVALLCALLAPVALAGQTGFVSFNATFGNPPVPGQFRVPYDTGPPARFSGQWWFIPTVGAPVPVGSPEDPIYVLPDSGGRLHRFSIYIDPTDPTKTLIGYHDDVNGNSQYDEGEAQTQLTVNT